MKQFAIVALLVLGSAMMATVSAHTASPTPLTKHAVVQVPSSVTSIAMPGDLGYRFKSGPGAELANAHCLLCHSSAYVATQPPLDRGHWTTEVTKMRKVYGAPMSDTDAQTIAEYLTREYGKH